jgi:ribosomal 30S subunit maturation factor RimM
VNGMVRAQVLTDFPEHFLELSVVNVGDNLRPYRIESVKPESVTILLKLEGVDDAAAGKLLRNQEIQIPIDQATRLPADQ